MRRFWLFMLLLLGAVAPMRVQPSNGGVLVLGRISDNPRAHYQQLKPLLDYVVRHMHDLGIREGRILMARDAQQMRSYVRQGKVDWISETTGGAILLQERAGAIPLLINSRNGVREYATVVLVRKDSPVQKLSDLRGRTIAFQNDLSTSSYYVPAAEMLRAGLHLEIQPTPLEKPADGTVGYVFARTERNISTWVVKGLVDAGAMSDIDWNDVRRVPPAYRSQFRVIYTSQSFPRALELASPSLPAPVRERLQQVLRDAAKDPAAADALRAFFATDRFEDITPQMQPSLRFVADSVKRVRAEVE